MAQNKASAFKSGHRYAIVVNGAVATYAKTMAAADKLAKPVDGKVYKMRAEGGSVTLAADVSPLRRNPTTAELDAIEAVYHKAEIERQRGMMRVHALRAAGKTAEAKALEKSTAAAWAAAKKAAVTEMRRNPKGKAKAKAPARRNGKVWDKVKAGARKVAAKVKGAVKASQAKRKAKKQASGILDAAEVAYEQGMRKTEALRAAGKDAEANAAWEATMTAWSAAQRQAEVAAKRRNPPPTRQGNVWSAEDGPAPTSGLKVSKVVVTATKNGARRNPGGNIKWHSHAGGTGAAHGKSGYTGISAGHTYSISPFTTQHGRHAGYLATVTPGERGLHAPVSPDGAETWGKNLYASPNAAKAAAKAHAAAHGARKNPKSKPTGHKRGCKCVVCGRPSKPKPKRVKR